MITPLNKRILVTGACGQIGSELVTALCDRYGDAMVMASDIHQQPRQPLRCEYLPLNVLNESALERIIVAFDIGQVYHLAAVLSASGEARPLASWELNIQGLLNVLEAAREHGLEKVFWPSSIAVFGPDSGKSVQQSTPTDPRTVYGISKVAGENWCRYYHEKYGLDVRSLRYPGLISHSAPPGGGTTDYAVDIFHKALAEGHYTCFLKKDTALPMMYMPDAIRATIGLMEAPMANISIRTAYNLGAMDFTPGELARAIQKKSRAFEVNYQPDFRQQIADSWPARVIDAQARRDWGWEPAFSLEGMVSDMLNNLTVQLSPDNAHDR